MMCFYNDDDDDTPINLKHISTNIEDRQSETNITRFVNRFLPTYFYKDDTKRNYLQQYNRPLDVNSNDTKTNNIMRNFQLLANNNRKLEQRMHTRDSNFENEENNQIGDINLKRPQLAITMSKYTNDMQSLPINQEYSEEPPPYSLA